MNDDELREHLRSTLEPVSSPTPELARLRRLARRRRRRLQATAGGLGLLLVAGAAIGIAEATTAGSGRAEVVPGAPGGEPAGRVTASCGSAPTGPPGSNPSTGISLEPGQSLTFVDCPPGARASAPGGGVLAQTAALTFQAVEPGEEKIVVIFAMCAELPATARPSCAGGVAESSFVVTVVAPSRSAKPVLVASLVSAPCKGGRVDMSSGGELTLADCPVGLTSHVDDPSVLAPGASASTFTALKPGTTNVELYVSRVCTPGTMCPKYVRDLGTLVVTVTPR